MRTTAAWSSALAPSPYTVSVGNATRPPLRTMAAARAIRSGSGLVGLTVTIGTVRPAGFVLMYTGLDAPPAPLVSRGRLVGDAGPRATSHIVPGILTRMSARLRRLLSLTALTLLAASCERISVGSEIAGELHRGRDFAAALTAHGRDTTITADSTATVVALAYLERQRLGLGSPFRLIDDALNYPRVADSTRRPLAWALLARTLDGAGDDVSPLALDALGVPSP